MKISVHLERYVSDTRHDKDSLALVIDVECIRLLEINGVVEGFAILTGLGYHDFLIRSSRRSAIAAVSEANRCLVESRCSHIDGIHLNYVLMHDAQYFRDLDDFTDAVQSDNVPKIENDSAEELKEVLKNTFGIE
jgi:hypothetical protein